MATLKIKPRCTGKPPVEALLSEGFHFSHETINRTHKRTLQIECGAIEILNESSTLSFENAAVRLAFFSIWPFFSTFRIANCQRAVLAFLENRDFVF